MYSTNRVLTWRAVSMLVSLPFIIFYFSLFLSTQQWLNGVRALLERRWMEKYLHANIFYFIAYRAKGVKISVSTYTGLLQSHWTGAGCTLSHWRQIPDVIRYYRVFCPVYTIMLFMLFSQLYPREIKLFVRHLKKMWESSINRNPKWLF